MIDLNDLDSYLNSVTTTPSDGVIKVPNLFPTITTPYKIALIGEAPGESEVNQGVPFVGSSGYLLTQVMASAGIARDACFIGNVCQIRPPGNDIKRFSKHGWEFTSGKQQLKEDLEKFDPNICVLLGDTAFGLTNIPDSIHEWRGSVSTVTDASSILFNRKFVATYHPAYVLRSYNDKPLFQFDLKKALVEGYSKTYKRPKRDLRVHITVMDLVGLLNSIKEGQLIAIDIETNHKTIMTCISIATSHEHAFICGFDSMDVMGLSTALPALKRVLENPNIFKVLQNSLFDVFVLAHQHGILVRGVVEDTMLKGWEIYSELSKGLATQTSIWTSEPFYKNDRKIPDRHIHYRYCCTDSAVTHEIAVKQNGALSKLANQHYRFNIAMLPIANYMQLKGIRYNVEAAREEFAKAELKQKEVYERIATRIGYKINCNSSQQMCKLLYDELKLPVQHPKKGAKYDRTKRTADQKSLLKLNGMVKEPVLLDVLLYRHYDSIKEQSSITVDKDGRMRCSYNVVGTDTGRFSCSGAPHGVGANLQTITYSLRHLYMADEGHYLFQCDLSGADGWTVAAFCASLGDKTMLLDYQAGIKPAKVIALLYKYGPVVNTWSRDEIILKSKEITDKGPDGWLYMACKRVQHGTNYMLGLDTMVLQIMTDAYKKSGIPVYPTRSDMQVLQNLYLLRYQGVSAYQRWIKIQIEKYGTLTSASGHTRRFFGRRNDNDTLRKALAEMPQQNTTYATNLASLQTWCNKRNRRSDESLIVEPLHQVHDAFIGQFPIDQTDFATQLINQAFQNVLTIAEIPIIIPYEGNYGQSWGELKQSF